jgi:hypothetical protein
MADSALTTRENVEVGIYTRAPSLATVRGIRSWRDRGLPLRAANYAWFLGAETDEELARIFDDLSVSVLLSHPNVGRGTIKAMMRYLNARHLLDSEYKIQLLSWGFL